MNAKIKLLALTYSPEDVRMMNTWQDVFADKFEIVAWSEFLEVPIQAAVKQYLDLNEIDGFLIDDIKHYDAVVRKQVEDMLSDGEMQIFAAAQGSKGVIASRAKSNLMSSVFGKEKLNVHANVVVSVA